MYVNVYRNGCNGCSRYCMSSDVIFSLFSRTFSCIVVLPFHSIPLQAKQFEFTANLCSCCQFTEALNSSSQIFDWLFFTQTLSRHFLIQKCMAHSYTYTHTHTHYVIWLHLRHKYVSVIRN